VGDAAMINFEQIQNKINQTFGGENLSQKKLGQKPEFHLIADLLPYRFFDEAKQIFLNDNSVGFILEAAPLIGANDDVIDTLSGMFSDAIPEGCTIQFINFASPKVGSIFDVWKESRYVQGGIYKKLAEKRIAYFKTANHQSIFDSSPLTLKNFRLIISVSLSIKKGAANDLTQQAINLISGEKKSDESSLAEVVNQVNSFKEKFKTTLRTAGIPSSEMTPENLINFLDEIINFNVSTHQKNLKYDPLQPINKQIVDHENHLKIERDQLTFFADDDLKKIHLRCFSVRNFPKNWAQWQCRDLIGDYFQDLRRMEYPFLTSFAVTLPHNEDALKAKAKAKNFNATRLQGSELSKFVPDMKTSASEWQFVTQKISAGQRILKTVYQAVIFAPTDKIDEAEQTLKSIYKGCGWDILRDKYINLQSFLATLPFTQSDGLFNDLEKLNRTKTMVSWTCANLAPLQGEWSGMDSPCMMLYGRRGQPLFWNPFKNTEGNYNVAVIGKSGSGKSVFMQELVTSIRGFGGKVYVIDDGRSFMNSARLQGGEFIEFSDKSNICLNPFSIIDAEAMKKNPEYMGEVIALIRSMIRQMCEGVKKNSESITQVQDRYIEEAVQNAWQKNGKNASISAIRDCLAEHADKRAKDLAILMRPFTKEGIYGRFFEGQSNIKLENPFMVFELAELKNKKEFQSIVMMFLMFLISENMYFGDRKTPISLLIDEAWDLLHGEGSSAFIEGLARRARKYGGNIITGTQSVNDYYKTSATLAAFENTDWIVLLAQKKESVEMLAQTKKVAMDESLKQALISLRMSDHQYSEALIYGPRGYAVGRLILDPYSIALYSSKAADWAKINDLIEQGYALPDALEQIAEEKSKNRKAKFLHPADYQKILRLKQSEGEERSFEDVLEEVIHDKFQQNFPQIADKFYNKKIAKFS
jgi:conjugal transfer ATP-binding protein TraC